MPFIMALTAIIGIALIAVDTLVRNGYGLPQSTLFVGFFAFMCLGVLVTSVKGYAWPFSDLRDRRRQRVLLLGVKAMAALVVIMMISAYASFT